MPKRGEGVHGGVDLLDREDRRVIDSELAEKLEDRNERDPDPLSNALTQLLERHPGGYVDQKQFVVEVSPDARPEDVVFDRWYFDPALNLLVDFVNKPENDEDRKSANKLVSEHAAFAKERGYRYLPIIGQITHDELAEAIQR